MLPRARGALEKIMFRVKKLLVKRDCTQLLGLAEVSADDERFDVSIVAANAAAARSKSANASGKRSRAGAVKHEEADEAHNAHDGAADQED